MLLEWEGHVALRLRSGVTLEGWILDVDDQSLRFESAPSPFYAQATGSSVMSPPASDIPLDEIEAYLDHTRVWQAMPSR